MTTMKINFLKFLLVVIILQPFINSMTGIAIKYNFSSFLGPLFYMIILFISTLYLITKKEIRILLIGIFILGYFILMYSTNRIELNNISDILKIFLPYIIYLSVKKLDLNQLKLKLIINQISKSIIIYSILILLSFLFSYQIQEGKGFFGFIYAGNDLILLLIFGLFFYSILLKNTSKNFVVVFLSYLLTGSKSIILVLIPIFFKILNNIKIFSKIIVIIIFVILTFYYVIPLFSIKLFIYFKDINNLATIFHEYELSYIFQVFSFGRTHHLINFYENMDKSFLDYIIGSGQIGAMINTDGKIGIEMDFFDAFNIYGIVGIIILISFYYIPIFFIKISNLSKIIFLIIVFYSIFGGHFFNNPLIGFYYGLLLGILKNKNFLVTRSFFEISDNHKYTRTI